jgi:alkyl hydroperoxide reductase subunit AhpC/MFS family permease
MPSVRLVPSGAGRDASLLLETRAVRAFGDGLVSVVLAAYLAALGLSDLRIGVVVTATLLGSAVLTLVVGLRAHRVSRRRLLRLVSLLMIATGLGFASVTAFWPLMVIAFVGTLNPSSGDVSVFLPTEQALLPATAPDTQRTALFARYSLIGALVAAVGALCAGVPEWIGDRAGVASTTALRWVFVGYAALGVVILVRYRHLSSAIEPAGDAPSSALGPSRVVVYRLAALFSLDAFGGGFVVTALLVLWLQRRFGLSITMSGAVFFWAGVLSAFSALVAVRIAARIGLVRTMVFTHLPANGFLILAAFMPTAPLAIAALLARSALSQMDVPARTSYVMAVVSPAERPAAASVTNVPRSLAAAVPAVAAGWMLGQSTFGWPLVIGGCLKATYDLLLLRQFRELRPPEEAVWHTIAAPQQTESAAAPPGQVGLARRTFPNDRQRVKGVQMGLQIGDTAPDFDADTTDGRIGFHDWIGDSWAVLFSHPKDFTPVCTTELGYMARLKPEFDRRGVKVIGLSVDATTDHEAWAQDIEDTQGARPNYPIIGDADFQVSKLYGMLPASTSGDPKQRTPADNQTVRNVFVIGPDKKVKLILVYPMTTGRNFDEVLRVIDSLQLTAKHRVATPVNWKQGDDVIIAGSVSNDEAKEIFGTWTEPRPYIRIVPQPS